MNKSNAVNNKFFNRWEEIFHSIDQPIVILNTDQEIIEANLSTIKLIGLNKSEIIGKKCYEIFHANNEDPSGCPFRNVIEFKDNKPVEMAIETLNGYYLISCSPVCDNAGNIEFIIHTATDITERKKNEDLLNSSVNEKEVLLREIHHRVKNNFQIISSLLNLQANSIKDENLLNLFNNAINRIRSMALIHEYLYQSNKFDFVDFKSYLETLIHELYENYKIDATIDIDLKIDNIFLDNDDAMHCGLMINEILTNSFKYAFPLNSQVKPLIIVSFINSVENFLVLKISDNGIGLPVDFDINKSKTLGMNLISSLIKQINAELTLSTTSGTEFIIKFKKKC